MAGIVINIAGKFDARDIKRAQESLGKLGGEAKKQSEISSKALKTLSHAAKAVGGAFAFKEIYNGLKELAVSAEENRKAIQGTDAILKATGRSGTMTAESITKMAGALSTQTGIAHTTIQAGQNLLLTFKHISNQVGAGNDVFDRATKAALDLSATGFGSVEQASKAIGKALDDPIGGMTALKKAGITLTDQQQKQVQAFVKSGDVLSAQKMILGQVEGKVKGVAEATADPIAKLQNAFKDLAEQIGMPLLDAIETLVGAISPILESLQEPLKSVTQAIASSLAPAISALAPVIGEIAKVAAPLWTMLANAVSKILPPVSAAFGKIVEAILPIIPVISDLIGAIVDALLPILQPLLDALAPIIKALVIGLTPILKIVGKLFGVLSPIIAIVAQVIGSLAQAIAPLLEIVGVLISTALEPLLPVITILLEPIVLLAKLLGGMIVGAINFLMPWIGKLVEYFGKFAAFMIREVGVPVSKMFADLANHIGDFLSGVLGKIPFVGKYFKRAGDDIKAFAATVTTQVGSAADGIESAASSMGDSLTTGATAAFDSSIPKVDDAAFGLGKGAGTSVASGVGAGIADGSSDTAKALADLLKSELDAASQAIDKFKQKGKDALDYARSVADSMKSYASAMGGASQDQGIQTTAGSIIANLQQKLSNIRKFGAALKTLRGMKLNPATFQEIVSAGPDAGLQVAQALIDAGKSAISQVNSLVAQIGGVDANGKATGAAGEVANQALQSQQGMTIAQAQGLANTTVTIAKQSVAVNVGAGTSGVDAAAIRAAVKTAVAQAIRDSQKAGSGAK